MILDDQRQRYLGKYTPLDTQSSLQRRSAPPSAIKDRRGKGARGKTKRRGRRRRRKTLAILDVRVVSFSRIAAFHGLVPCFLSIASSLCCCCWLARRCFHLLPDTYRPSIRLQPPLYADCALFSPLSTHSYSDTWSTLLVPPSRSHPLALFHRRSVVSRLTLQPPPRFSTSFQRIVEARWFSPAPLYADSSSFISLLASRQLIEFAHLSDESIAQRNPCETGLLVSSIRNRLIYERGWPTGRLNIPCPGFIKEKMFICPSLLRGICWVGN